MSWVPMTHWTLRCDGSTTQGLCDALLFGAPDERQSAVAWNADGDRITQPLLFTERPALAQLRAEPVPGWLVTRERVLCPEHVRAEERVAHAAVDGLPFDDI